MKNNQARNSSAPVHSGLAQMVSLRLIDLSPTNPRTRFNQLDLDELAADIKKNGVLQNLIVRPSPLGKKRFELIAGERRHRAAQIAGLADVPVVVRDVSTDDALDIQIAENLHRKDISPLDEAAAYERLREVLACSNDELAARVGKKPEYVLARLRLNHLTEAVKQAFDDGVINLVMITEIAKYPSDAQTLILERAFSRNDTGAITGANFETLVELKRFISRNVLLELANAPFSTKATDLRPDGLPCVNCPERTGAARQLFADFEDKGDSCLNQACYTLKTTTLIQIQREKTAEKINREVARNVKTAAKAEKLSKEATRAKIGEQSKTFADVPLISWNSYHSQAPDGVLRDEEYKTIHEHSQKCDSIETAVYINGYDRTGKVQEICRNAACQIHWKNSSPNTMVKNQLEKSRRNEELFDIKVGEDVRREVFAGAVGNFTASHWVFDRPEWRTRILARLWERTEYKHRALAKEIAGLDDKEYISDVSQLPPEAQSRLFFGLMVAHLGEMPYAEYHSQEPVKKIAEEFAVNYRHLDAKKRVEKAAKKYADIAKIYLAEVEAENAAAEIPRFWLADYKPK